MHTDTLPTAAPARNPELVTVRSSDLDRVRDAVDSLYRAAAHDHESPLLIRVRIGELAGLMDIAGFHAAPVTEPPAVYRPTEPDPELEQALAEEFPTLPWDVYASQPYEPSEDDSRWAAEHLGGDPRTPQQLVGWIADRLIGIGLAPAVQGHAIDFPAFGREYQLRLEDMTARCEHYERIAAEYDPANAAGAAVEW